jgi:hypothetical protein
MAGKISQPLPRFHGDFDVYPDESWEGYEIQLLISRMATGHENDSDEMIKGQMLAFLKINVVTCSTGSVSSGPRRPWSRQR